MRRAIYDGAIQANVVGSFVRLGETFMVIHPGYDAQGRKRTTWVQVVHDGIPIWEHKLSADKTVALARFAKRLDEDFGENAEFMRLALDRCKSSRRTHFMDGESGVEPAPTLADGRSPGIRATS